MTTIHIPSIVRTLSIDVVRPLQTFLAKKEAAAWCMDNNIKPLRIVKIETRFEYLWIIDMGHNSFIAE